MKTHKITVKRYNHSPTSRYVVDSLGLNGKRVRRFFATKKDAEIFAEQKRIEVENFGVRALNLPEPLRITALEGADKLKPFGRTLEEAAEHYIAHLQSCERSITVAKLIEEYMQAKANKGASATYLKDLRYRLPRVVAKFGDQLVATITTAQIDDWLTDLNLSGQSQNNFRAVLSTLFNYAVRRGYADTNPVQRVDKVKVVEKPPAIFTPNELERLLAVAPVDILPVFVLGAFAGLRQAEIMRLEWKDIDLARGLIHVSAEKAKSSKRRLVKILPTLAEWLRPYAAMKGRIWPLSETRFRQRMYPLLKPAEIEKWPENGLRHSYASYHLAHFNDAPRLALEMGHTTTAMLFAHYREVVTPSNAERYWQIKPQTEENEKIVAFAQV